MSNSMRDENHCNKLLRHRERKMLRQSTVILLFRSQKKGGGYRASGSAPAWWLEPAKASICPHQRPQEEWWCQRQTQQRRNHASPACQHVIRVFLWEPRAEAGGRRRGREGGGRREEGREMEEMKGSMPVRHSSLS